MNIRNLFKTRRRREAELDEEIRSHLQLAAQDRIDHGQSPDDARRGVVKEFGNVALVKEVTRDAWGLAFWESWIQDIRLSLRMLARNPVLTVVAALSIGLGIAANVTIFSFVNALLFTAPAVESPSRLVEIWNYNPAATSVIEAYMPLSFPEFAHYRDNNQTLSGLIAFDSDSTDVTWNRDGLGETVHVAAVSGDFFSLLGVRTVLGRALTADDDQRSATPVVVLSHAFWTRRLGADPAVVGKTLTLNASVFTVAGVAPAEFTSLEAGIVPDLWAPMTMAPQITLDRDSLTSTSRHWLMAVGRLKPDVNLSQSESEFTVLAGRKPQQPPEIKESTRGLNASVFPLQLVPGPFRGYVAGFTGVLMVVAGLVLLIACANVTNLMLARSASRRREMAIRLALGAGRLRLIRLVLTESLLIALLGGALGLVMASWAKVALLGLKPVSIPVQIQAPTDFHVFGFTLLLSAIAGVVFGIAPALRNSRAGLTLRTGPQSGNIGRSRTIAVLVVAQISICLLLLVSAGLCVRSLANARSIDPGFETKNCLIATIDTATLGYSDKQSLLFDRKLIDRVRDIPDVQAASLASYLPLTTTRSTIQVETRSSDGGAQSDVIQTISVAPDFFRTMGTPILAGREFTFEDRQGASEVAVINEALASAWWPNSSALGQHLTVPWSDSRRSDFEIVGVVKTGKYRSLSEAPTPFVYLPLLQNYAAKVRLVARTTGDPAPLLRSLSQEVRTVDPRVALIDAETMDQYMALPLFPVHTFGLLLGVLGFVALVLAITGLYGVLAYGVARRTSEFGIRMALGARWLDIMRMVLKQSLTLTLLGLAIGLALAFGATGALASLLYGIGPSDPLTLAGVTLLLATVAVLASMIPARRATRIDPAAALRCE